MDVAKPTSVRMRKIAMEGDLGVDAVLTMLAVFVVNGRGDIIRVCRGWEHQLMSMWSTLQTL
jgi:hypothetical protein